MHFCAEFTHAVVSAINDRISVCNLCAYIRVCILRMHVHSKLACVCALDACWGTSYQQLILVMSFSIGHRNEMHLKQKGSHTICFAVKIVIFFDK